VDGRTIAYPDTLVGTDSHTTMINGLGVLGWGVGGIEAEAAMLGQPISMLIPEVVGFKLSGKLNDGITATDLVLRVVEMLRAHGVVGKFVEFCGSGSRNTCQHGAGVWRDLWLLPNRRRDHQLPPVVGSAGRYGGAGRGLCQSPGHVARGRCTRCPVLCTARVRLSLCRAQSRRPQATPRARSHDRYENSVR